MAKRKKQNQHQTATKKVAPKSGAKVVSLEQAKPKRTGNITGFAWDGSLEQIHQNVDTKDWPKFQIFDDYMEIHNDEDVDLVDPGDYILHNHDNNHYSSCSAEKYHQDYQA